MSLIRLPDNDVFVDRRISQGHVVKGKVTTNVIREGKHLAELRKYDDENHRLILQNAREYSYDTIQQAWFSMSQFLRSALKKLGIRAIEDWHAAGPSRASVQDLEKRLVAEMAEKDVHLETRTHVGIDIRTEGWKTGKYVYYKGDIEFFISNPHSKRKFRSGIVIVGQVDYCLRTNAPVLT